MLNMLVLSLHALIIRGLDYIINDLDTAGIVQSSLQLKMIVLHCISFIAKKTKTITHTVNFLCITHETCVGREYNHMFFFSPIIFLILAKKKNLSSEKNAISEEH